MDAIQSEAAAALADLRAGDTAAGARLFEVIYGQLRLIAEREMARHPGGTAGQTLQPTALVHEVYLRLIREDRTWQDHSHFLQAAALAMRRILLDRTRARRAQKRGGGLVRADLDELDGGGPHVLPADGADWEALDRALQQLERLDDRAFRVVMLRFFAGLGVAETAAALGIAERTVVADWRHARAWLHARLTLHEEQSHG